MPSLNPVFKRARPALGTTVEISLSAPDAETSHAAITRAFHRLEVLERVFSAFDPESELSRVNAGRVGEAIPVSEELSSVLQFGAEIEALSHGAFRLMPKVFGGYRIENGSVVRLVDHGFDLGGIAKGDCVDRVFEVLSRENPEEYVCVNAGGDLRTSHGGIFELRVPTEEGERRYGVKIGAGALATSSDLRSRRGLGTPSARFQMAKGSSAGPRTTSIYAANCRSADAFAKVGLFGDLSQFESRVKAAFTFSAAGLPL